MKELRTKTKPEIIQNLNTLKAELSQLRLAKVTGGAANKLSKIHSVRKSIARVLTVYNQTIRKDILSIKKKNGVKRPLDMRYKTTRAIRLRLTPHQAAAMTLRQKKKARHQFVRRYALKN